MLRFGLLLCLVELTVGYPPVVKTREEIDAFRQYLEKSREDNGHRVESRMLSNVTGNIWENSGKFEGDILLDDWQIEALVTEYATGRNAVTWPGSTWPGNVVVFEFKKHEFSSKQRLAIRDAMRLIERNSCVKFRPRRDNEPNYALITGRPEGCHSTVSYMRTRIGPHIINLARSDPGQGCLKTTAIVHEWFHILGFWHMHSTYNRDDYVRIEFQNIQDGQAHNFNNFRNDIVSNLGVPYEYTSCMHYSSHAFSKNGQPTIVPLKPFVGTMGQTDRVTENDWLRLRRHYNCPGAWDRDGVKRPSTPEPGEIPPVIVTGENNSSSSSIRFSADNAI